ncbi:MAG TPA: AAA family ATPase [Thermodesulfobacteriota bacterium]|nr:AAA family ATPase [Thermodesulfobacteriota bacterium]
MYQEYFGLTEKPFSEPPNSKFFYPSEKHREGLAHLEFNIKDGKGFTVLTGEVGTGKTTLCQTLMNRLDRENILVAHIIHTNLDFQEFLREVVEELGIPVESRQRWDLLKALNQFLIEMYSRNRKVVLIIDEAQNLDPQVLEGIRMLSNLETPKDKLIQIVFIGQPGLLDHILLPDMTQLKQRIAGYYVLGPLSCEETGDYVSFRMSRVQSKPSLRFTPQALQLIYEWSGGIPRLINILCDLSLLHAFLAECWTVGQSLVQKAARDLKGPAEEEERASRVKRLKEATDNEGTVAVPEAGLIPETGLLSPIRGADLRVEDRGQDFVPDLLFPIEKSSMRKKIALALGGFLTLCGLGFYFLGERIGSEYWSTKADSPVYQISIPIDDPAEGLPPKPSPYPKKLSRINPETGY